LLNDSKDIWFGKWKEKQEKLVMMTFDAILRVIYLMGLYDRQRKAKFELLFDHPHQKAKKKQILK
jgi:hypothetical protein